MERSFSVKVLDAMGNPLTDLFSPTLVDPVGLGYDGRLLVTDNNAGSPLIRFLDPASGVEQATFAIAASVDLEMLDSALLSVYPDGDRLSAVADARS